MPQTGAHKIGPLTLLMSFRLAKNSTPESGVGSLSRYRGSEDGH
jgi:hypothetical protein